MLAFIPLPDDLYIKDLIDLEDQGFFVEFERYPMVKANKDIYIWAGKYNCKHLYADTELPVKVRHNGHLGVAMKKFVLQNANLLIFYSNEMYHFIFRVDGEEGKFEAKVYIVKKHWTLEIDVNGIKTEVYKVKDEVRTKLTADDVKTYEIDFQSGLFTHQKVREMFKTVNEGMETVGKVVKTSTQSYRAVQNVIEGEEPVDMVEDSLPSGRRPPRSICGFFRNNCSIL